MVAAIVAAAIGCGGNVMVEQDAGAGGAGGSGGSGAAGGTTSTTTTTSGLGGTTGSGGGAATGDCSTDADCPGGTCIELAPGGWKTCGHVPDEAKACTSPPPPMPDECCASSDCAGGRCYRSSDVPYCGGMPMPEYNVCIVSGCASDADCIHGNPNPYICLPAGAFGQPERTCFTGYCHTNADCSAHPGGRCEPIQNPCCGVPQGLACVYPGGCRKDSDCANDGSQHCAIEPSTGSAVCVPGMVGCPA